MALKFILVEFILVDTVLMGDPLYLNLWAKIYIMSDQLYLQLQK